MKHCVYDTWGQVIKLFFDRNLLMFEQSREFVSGKPFQPSLMFVIEAEAHQSGVTEPPLG
jgi:hypothetical protein